MARRTSNPEVVTEAADQRGVQTPLPSAADPPPTQAGPLPTAGLACWRASKPSGVSPLGGVEVVRDPIVAGASRLPETCS